MTTNFKAGPTESDALVAAILRLGGNVPTVKTSSTEPKRLPCPFGKDIVHYCGRCSPTAVDIATACDYCMPCTDMRCMAAICPTCTVDKNCMRADCMYNTAPPTHCIETCPYDD